MTDNASARQARVIAAAERDIDDLIRAVSHDLRAPLRHIEGFLALFRTHAEAQLDGPGRQHLDRIAQASARMIRMIDDLRTYARDTGGELNRVPVALTPLLHAVIDALPRGADTRRVEWQVGDLPAAWADRDLLRRALAHLIGNAVKFTCRRDAPHIEITASHSGADMQLCVADNGEGFDMKYADRLFKLFDRLHTDPIFGGAGIGLATVARIAGRHGGRAWAEGVAGQGAKFFISFPAQP
jgi:signal transduction histidine kinase